jgi:hypothetical protein
VDAAASTLAGSRRHVERPKIRPVPIAFARAAWHVDCSIMSVCMSRHRPPSSPIVGVVGVVGVVAGLVGLLVASASSVGCKKDDAKAVDPAADEAQALAEDGTDSAVAETDAEVVTSSLVSATAAGGSLTLASTSELTLGGVNPTGLGDGATRLYFPSGCLKVTPDAAARTVTYAFTGCAGPNGIFRLTGTIVATYATAPGRLTLQLVGNDLRVNRSTVDWTATAEITNTGADRAMHWKGALSGTTARGKTFSRTNDKTVTWRFGERCFGVSGVSEGNVRDRYLRTEITDFRRCQGACPEAGGRITISNEKKVTVDIQFDGTNRATFTSPKGTTTFDLACQG